MNDLRIIFGRVLREHREQQGLSQEELADLAGIHRTYISSIELGKVGAGLDVLYKISIGLNIPLSNLISDTERRLAQRNR